MERLSREPRGAGLKALWPFGRKSADVVTKLNLTEPEPWAMPTVAAGVSVTENSVLALSAAWACVNLLAGTIASLPLMVYRDVNGQRVVARDHPLYRVLHDSPNFDQTAMDFWEGGVAALELRGNLHARIERARDRVIALHPAFGVQVRRVSSGGLRYRWSEDGKSFDEPQENMLHVRGFGGSPLGGLSTLSHGRQVFGLSSAVNTAAGGMFANGMLPSTVISFKEFLQKEQRDPFERALIEKFVGAMNAGRPYIAEGGSEVKTLSFSPEDAQMLESRGFSVEEVCRFFGVPPVMIGHTSKASSWPTSTEAQGQILEKFTLRKRLKRIEQAIMKQLLTPADRAAGVTVEFNFEGLLRGDSTGRASFYQSGLQNGWMTINEVRALENLPPVEGGEVPRMQMQNVPITQAADPAGLPSPEQFRAMLLASGVEVE